MSTPFFTPSFIEVEQNKMAMTISPQECKAKVEIHDDARHDFMSTVRPFTLKVTHTPTKKQIGLMTGSLINRNRSRGRFLAVLDEETDELHKFSQGLFDKNGMVKAGIVDSEFHKGLGAWGRELDQGLLVYVDNVRVDTEYRRKGIGSWMLSQLVQSKVISRAADPYGFFVIAWPTLVGGGMLTKEAYKTGRDGLVNFFRQNGFRRIGRTQFFGYAPTPNHPSRAIAPAQDSDGYMKPLDDEDYDTPIDPGNSEAVAQRQARIEAKYPIHFAIGDASRPNYLGFPFNQVAPPIIPVISDAFMQDPESVHKRDQNGMTPLHIAAAFGCSDAIEALLSPGIVAHSPPDINRRDNTEGKTPLECLEADMRSTREFADAMLADADQKPASDAHMRSLWLLKRAMGENVGTMAEYMRQHKWGCTCGECWEGWFSRRMRYRIKFGAGDLYQAMEDSRLRFRDDGMILTPGVDELPAMLQAQAAGGFHDSYREVVRGIYQICNEQEGVPSVSKLFQATKHSGRMFYTKGGSSKHALEAVMRRVKAASPVGDGVGVFDQNAEESGEWVRLPKCENDLEFRVVRIKLGLPGFSPEKEYPGGDEEGFDEEDFDDDAIEQGMF